MKMDKIIDHNLFAPCGVNYSLCYVYLDLRKSGKSCRGCLNNNNDGKPNHCISCSIKKCVTSRDKTYCFECELFPCKKLKNLSNSYKKRYKTNLIERGFLAKDIGIEKLLEKDRIEYSCYHCAGIISLQNNICSECFMVVNHED